MLECCHSYVLAKLEVHLKSGCFRCASCCASSSSSASSATVSDGVRAMCCALHGAYTGQLSVQICLRPVSSVQCYRVQWLRLMKACIT